ncbi:NAD(P)H-dependent oxidoreductase [Salicibibacter cibarius]|uniref:NAD(P)H-dependent oxidoreductase n=1 Tax=Salicibibacter cibarius TaxID=2743000 RepID=A0A7T7CCI2_9BACI|nr:NAD(P)H-dependent oxidoreductase [Salicibibacter cibarius]QQK77012.1 NAD(P)H-dependent oxidoreductase [Salicibibacter cibarius]
MHLIVHMHPSKDSFNHAVLTTYQEALQKAGKEVVVRDLYRLGFAPLLMQAEYECSLLNRYEDDVAKEHAYVKQAEAITFLFPVWWGGFPAIGKGYLDRVLTYGFAYELENESPIPKMEGKPLGMIYTTGAPRDVWEKGQKHWMEHLFKAAIADFCGFRQIPPLHLGNAVLADDSERERMFASVRAYASEFPFFRES